MVFRFFREAPDIFRRVLSIRVRGNDVPALRISGIEVVESEFECGSFACVDGMGDHVGFQSPEDLRRGFAAAVVDHDNPSEAFRRKFLHKSAQKSFRIVGRNQHRCL